MTGLFLKIGFLDGSGAGVGGINHGVALLLFVVQCSCWLVGKVLVAVALVGFVVLRLELV